MALQQEGGKEGERKGEGRKEGRGEEEGRREGERKRTMVTTLLPYFLFYRLPVQVWEYVWLEHSTQLRTCCRPVLNPLSMADLSNYSYHMSIFFRSSAIYSTHIIIHFIKSLESQQ